MTTDQSDGFPWDDFYWAYWNPAAARERQERLVSALKTLTKGDREILGFGACGPVLHAIAEAEADTC